MKHISKFFTSWIIILSFFSVVLWWSCDSLEAAKDRYDDELSECMIECRETDTQENCLRYDCEYEYEDYLEAEEEYNECIACLSCTNWQCCETCDNSDWCNERDIRSWVSRCPQIPSSEINEATAPYLIEDGDHCCFEEIDNTYNCDNWGIIPRMQEKCPDIANKITSDNVHNIQERDWYCCFSEWSDSDYSCSLLDSVYQKKSECPDIADQINWDTIDYVQVKNWYCCMEGGWTQYSDLSCVLQEKRYQCPNLASEISYTNATFIDTNQCCFSMPEDEDVYDENWFLLDTLSYGDCSYFWSNYVLEWNCCIVWSWCANPPHNEQCDSWYRLEGACCVEIPCEEINSWDKQKCDARINKWEAVKRENCSCVCDPAKWCCGVQLNVPLPFIGDCIELTNSNSTAGARDGSISINQLNAFPVLIKWISKIIVTLIMIFSVIVVIFAWVMMTTSVANESNYKTWLEMLKKVIIALILLWTSWLILKLINPTFFWG